MPGSPERILLRNPNLSQEVLEAQKAKWGLDKPLFPDQFVDYIAATAQGDFGESFKYRGKSALEVIAGRVMPTLILFGLGELIAIVVGLLLGAYSGWRRGGRGGLRRQRRLAHPLFHALLPAGHDPAGHLRLEPGLVPDVGHVHAGRDRTTRGSTRLADFAHHLILPLAAVSLGLIGQYSILMRSSVIETRSDDYVQTARAKGLKDSRILRSHAVPNALLPTVSLIGINIGFIIAGAITVEVVFSWPGLGTLTQEALQSRDYPLLQAHLLHPGRLGRARQPGRGHRLRLARSPGQGVSAGQAAAAAMPTRPSRPVSRLAAGTGLRSPLRASPGGPHRAPHHRLLRHPGHRAGVLRRPPRDRHHGLRRPPGSRPPPSTSWAPTTSAATCSTRPSTGPGSRCSSASWRPS